MDAARFLNNNQRGIALVYLVILLVALIGIATLVIDLGFRYVTKAQMQTAADAGALAGAGRLNGRGIFDNYSARVSAKFIAEQNKSAGSTVVLDLNDTSNNADGDIVLGCWTSGETIDTNPTSCPNASAVKVVIRRTKATGNATNTFFAKTLGSFFNQDFSSYDLKATAIAAMQKANVMPIAVNEYWLQRSPPGPGGKPYGSLHDYPQSFVRKKNVDLTDSQVFGWTFAILGADASDNIPSGGGPGSQNLNGLINLNVRSSRHDGSGASWFVHDPTSIGWTCSGCDAGFSAAMDKLSTGAVSSTKFDETLSYLANGYPYDFIAPIPAKELLRTSPAYPNSSSSFYDPDPSSCPYSTVAFFSSSGAQPLNKQLDGSKYLSDLYPAGKKFIALVYDGTFQPDVTPSAPGTVTIVGYSAIQVDGYSSGNPKSFLTSPGPTAPGAIGTKGNSLYGHAIADILDPPNSGTLCGDFTSKLNQLRISAGEPKLVY